MSSEIWQDDTTKLTIYRDAPSWDGVKTGALGSLKINDPIAGGEAIGTVLQDLAHEGFAAVLAPMDGDTWHSYRVVTESDNSQPFLMEPTADAPVRDALVGAGFEDIAHYFSARVPIAKALGDAPAALPEIEIETWDGSDPEAHFSTVYDLSLAAFSNNLFYKPISKEAFLGMYLPVVPMLRRELILLAREKASGALVGFLFGIPNYQEGPTSRTVILKTYASLRPGVGHLMSHQFHLAAQALGFETVIHALIQDDNRSAERSRKHGAEIFRRYALMGRRLG